MWVFWFGDDPMIHIQLDKPGEPHWLSTPGDRAVRLLRKLAQDVYVWRVMVIESALFIAEHGEVIAVEPLRRDR
jgi:hypothetical protein